MLFTEIKTFTYTSTTASVNGVDREVTTTLDESIDAVQFHKGRDYLLEETENGMVKVPFTKYQSILDEWVEAGAVVPEILTAEQLLQKLKGGIQNYLNSKAVELGFDSIDTISKYMGWDNKYRTDAEALALLAVTTWDYIEAQFVEIEAGNRTIPTLEEALVELENL